MFQIHIILKNFNETKNLIYNKIQLYSYQQYYKGIWNSLIHLQKRVSNQFRVEVSGLVYDDKNIQETFSQLLQFISDDYQNFQNEIQKYQNENENLQYLQEQLQGFESIKQELIISHLNEIKLLDTQIQSHVENNLLLNNQISELEEKLNCYKDENKSSYKDLEIKISQLLQKIDEKNLEIEFLKCSLAENQPQIMKQYTINQEKNKIIENQKDEFQTKLKHHFNQDIVNLKKNYDIKYDQALYQFKVIEEDLKDQIAQLTAKLTATSQNVESLNHILSQNKSFGENGQFLLEQITRYEKLNQNLNSQLQESKNNSINLQIQKNKLESELSHNKSLIEQLNKTILEFRNKYDQNQENNITKQKQLEHEKNALTKQINELNAKMVLTLEENIDRIRKEEQKKRENIITELKINHKYEINEIIQKHEQKTLDLKDQLRKQMEDQQIQIAVMQEKQAKIKKTYEEEIIQLQELINQIKCEHESAISKLKEEQNKELQQAKQNRERDKVAVKGENDKFKERVRKRVIEEVKKENNDEIEKLKQLIQEWEYKCNEVQQTLSTQYKNQTAKVISQYDVQINEGRKLHEQKQYMLEENIKILQEEKVLILQSNKKLNEEVITLKIENKKYIENSTIYKTLNEELAKNYDRLQKDTQIKATEYEKDVEKLCSEIREVKSKVTNAYEYSYNQQLEEQERFVRNMEKSVNELQNLHRQEVKDLKEQIKELQILFNLRPSKTEDIKNINLLQEELSSAQKKISQFELEHQNIKKTYDVFKPQPQSISQHTALHSFLNNMQLNSSQITIPFINANLHSASVHTTINNASNQPARFANTPSRTLQSPTTRLNTPLLPQKRIQTSQSNYPLNQSSTDNLINHKQNQKDKNGNLQNLNRTVNDSEFLLQNENILSKTSTNIFRPPIIFKQSKQNQNKRPKRIKTEQDEDDETENNQTVNMNKNSNKTGRLFQEGTIFNSSYEELKRQLDPSSPLKNNIIQLKLKPKAGIKLTLQDAIQKKNYVAVKQKSNTSGIFSQENDQNCDSACITSAINQKSLSLNPRNCNKTINRQRINTVSNLVEKNQIQMQKNSIMARKIRDQQLKCLSMQRPMSSFEFEH